MSRDRPFDVAITSDPPPRLHSTREGEIAWSEEGPLDAPTVVCLHGVPGSARDFRYLAPLLNESFRVIRVEMPGFGSSPIGPISSVGGWSRVASAVAEETGPDQYLLLGHSFGGATALHAASRDPTRIRGLILLASPGARRHRGYTFPPFVFRWIRVGLGTPGLRDPLARMATDAYRRLGLPEPLGIEDLRRQFAVIGSLDFAHLGRLAQRIPIPVLTFHSRDDRMVQVSIAEEFCERFSRAELTVFENGGHHLQKARAEEIAAHVKNRFGSVP